MDTSKSTLYVFENHNGEPRYVADYYMTIGKNGIDKKREGDKKTPLGVYHVTSSMPRQKLTDFYGAGRFRSTIPTSGTAARAATAPASGCTARPRTPTAVRQASDGCVVLTNQDSTAISRM